MRKSKGSENRGRVLGAMKTRDVMADEGRSLVSEGLWMARTIWGCGLHMAVRAAIRSMS